jgi:hypothetical protein
MQFKPEIYEEKPRSIKSERILDLYTVQLEELFEVLYPSKSKDSKARRQFIKDCISKGQHKGVWVYFPWSQILVRTLSEEDYYKLRTNRNRNLISEEEQKKIKSLTVGIAGLSIGINTALTLARLGVNNLKIADFDKLTTSNLNRIPAGLVDIGVEKSVMATKQLCELDPFMNLVVFDKGLNKGNLEEFFTKPTKLDLIIDAIDDFEIKIRLRILGKQHKIPVLMFTNLGDGCLVDIERYDKDSNLDVFNGLLGDLPEQIINSKITEDDKQRLAAKLVGIESVPTKALASLAEIGKTLVGRPQLASTVSASSGLAGFIVKKIALEEECKSGRHLVHFDTDYFSAG